MAFQVQESVDIPLPLISISFKEPFISISFKGPFISISFKGPLLSHRQKQSQFEVLADPQKINVFNEVDSLYSIELPQ